MKTYNKEDIIEDYRNLQLQFPDKLLTRSEYRKFGEYSTSLIEKLFGNWTNFVKEVGFNTKMNRYEIIKKSRSKKIIISSIIDGLDINEEAFNILKTYARWNGAELFLFWTKNFIALPSMCCCIAHSILSSPIVPVISLSTSTSPEAI